MKIPLSGWPVLTCLLVFLIHLSCSRPPLLDKEIGQMLLVGFRGYELPDSSQLAADLKAGKVGGVILFDYDIESKKRVRNIRTPQQVKALVDQVKGYSKYPLWVAIDQEGGAVSRLKASYGFPSFPQARYLGALGHTDSTHYYAELSGKTMKALGINVNFAPVVDLDINPENPAIGKYGRSFSDSAAVVIEHARAVIQAQEKQGILSVLKHFPGHGSSDKDSHNGIVEVSDSWQKEELKPYRMLARDSMLLGVMTAHIYNRHLDPEYPATLSASTIGMLRKEINFEGVVFSDDMQMKAISREYPLKEVIRLGINAGIDVFVFGNNLAYEPDLPERFQQHVLELLKEGAITESQIRASFARIQQLKARMNLPLDE